MIIDDVHRGIQKNKKRKRVGRGPGSGHGKTSTRGHKGYGSRAGASRRPGFEGGQTPLARRIAKRGFSNARFAKKVAIVNLRSLEEAFEAGETVSPETLREKGVLKGRYDVLKVLGEGELTKKLTVVAHRFSKSASAAIEKAGGSTETIAPPPKPVKNPSKDNRKQPAATTFGGATETTASAADETPAEPAGDAEPKAEDASTDDAADAETGESESE